MQSDFALTQVFLDKQLNSYLESLQSRPHMDAQIVIHMHIGFIKTW